MKGLIWMHWASFMSLTLFKVQGPWPQSLSLYMQVFELWCGKLEVISMLWLSFPSGKCWIRTSLFFQHSDPVTWVKPKLILDPLHNPLVAIRNLYLGWQRDLIILTCKSNLTDSPKRDQSSSRIIRASADPWCVSCVKKLSGWCGLCKCEVIHTFG